MLIEVSGDILLSQAQAIAHGVAPSDHFDRGLALSLRERWPSMYKDFRHFCKVKNPSAGGLWTWGGVDGVRIVSLLTQDPAPSHNAHPGKASHQNVNNALKALRKEIEDQGFTSVALPRVATGVGGLDWADVQPLIRKHLGDLEVPVYLYTEFRAGEKADEALAAKG